MTIILMKFANSLCRRDEGATAIEYGLIASLIAVAIITGATAVGSGVSATFTSVAGHL
ncbi:Flp family type IVb pilin [Pendulispora albinea]|uniref:Flp family type IVb pilin n=1 Tax=Pendulispora albinea TaxID=2741071 RepID=A0ABZ2LMI4_9BACT